MRLTAFRAMSRPVSIEPVKLMAAMSRCPTRASPTTEPDPMTRLKTPGGIPAAARMSASIHAHPGVHCAGLKTTVLPKASAGAIFHDGMAIGKFQGVIRPMTPTGSRVISTSTPGRTEGSFSPDRRSASPAKNLKMWPARTVSPTPSASVFPSSRESSRPSSSLRARMSDPALSRMFARSWIELTDHVVKAFLAASMAASACAASAIAYSPMTSLRSDGLRLGVHDVPGVHSPLM